MNHPGEIARSGATARGPPWRWSTTRSASTRSSCTRSKRSRARTARSSRRCRPTASRCFRPTIRARRIWRSWPGTRRVSTSALDRRRDRDRDLRAATPTAADGVDWRRRGRASMCACGAGRAQRAQCAGRGGVRARCRRAAGGDRARAAAFRRSPGAACSARSVSGALLIDDTYNANPDSVRAAIDVLARLPGAARAGARATWAKSATSGPEMHREVGAYARERGIDACSPLGDADARRDAAFGAGGVHFDDIDALVAPRVRLAAGRDGAGQGSRFMRMERVVRALTANRPVQPDRRSRTDAARARPMAGATTYARSTSSATSRCARCWLRRPRC